MLGVKCGWVSVLWHLILVRYVPTAAGRRVSSVLWLGGSSLALVATYTGNARPLEWT